LENVGGSEPNVAGLVVKGCKIILSIILSTRVPARRRPMKRRDSERARQPSSVFTILEAIEAASGDAPARKDSTSEICRLI
jgi:hypothetical protein